MRIHNPIHNPINIDSHGNKNPNSICSSGKIVYFSEAKARIAKDVILEKKSRNLKPYKCQFGNHWHLTHINKDEKRKDHRIMRRRQAKEKRLSDKQKQ